uniref:Checkpoint protein n=1 Tax=Parastrongyloides trichosuri TaxID=131310 RepID=A0A0N4Z9F2_PARTI
MLSGDTIDFFPSAARDFQQKESFLESQLNETIKGVTFCGCKYVLRKNFSTFIQLIRHLAVLGGKIFFIPRRDGLILSTYNSTTYSYTRIFFDEGCFSEISSSNEMEEEDGCCMSRNAALSAFKIPPEIAKATESLTFDVETSGDYMDLIIVGPDKLRRYCKIELITFNNPRIKSEDFTRTNVFSFVSPIPLWKSVFTGKSNNHCQIVLEIQNESLIIRRKDPKTETLSRSKIVMNMKKFIEFEFQRPVKISLSYHEFAIAYKISNLLSGFISMEIVEGHVPIKFSLYQSQSINFEMYCPGSIDDVTA